MLIVLFLLAVILSWSARKMFFQKSKVGPSLQALARLNRQLYTRSRLYGTNYRLVLQLNPERPEEFWAEKQTDGEAFTPDQNILKQPVTLHPFLSVVSAESGEWTEAKTEGPIYIHYRARGLGQETALHIERKDTKAKWTIYFHPVQRELEVIKNHVPLSEIQEGI